MDLGSKPMKSKQMFPGGNERGTVLLLAVLVTLVVGMFSAATVSTTLARTRNTEYTTDRLSARTLAEAILESAQRQLLEMTAQFQDPFAAGSTSYQGTSTVGGVVYNWIGEDLTVEVYGASEVDSSGWHELEKLYDRTDAGQPNPPLQTIRTRVVRLSPENGAIVVGKATSRLVRTVEIQRFPLFDFAIFYDDDLELLPGPSMTFAGKVHANGDIYVCIGGSKTLTIDSDYFRCTGEIYRERKNNGSTTGGTVSIKDSFSGAFQTLDNDQDFEAWATPDEWVDFADGRWGGTVQTGSHGVSDAPAPEIGSIANNGYYRNTADLVVHNDRVYHVIAGVETDITNQVSGAISEHSDLYDARQETYVPVTEIDLSDPGLQNYISGANGDSDPTNDIHQVYAYRSPEPEPANWDPALASNWFEGIKLVNGDLLPDDLLFVSEDPIYVHGDFNTDSKKTAAVISDAVNLLSNSWDDTRDASDSHNDISHASETTFNMALITGNVRTPDGGGNYSGGLENLPRFHENWGGTKANINGAFINLFQSRVATERWGKSGVYKPPTRAWGWDPDLLNSSVLRDLFPQTAEVQRLVWTDSKPPVPVIQ